MQSINEIKITDADIKWVESILGNIHFDEEHINVIKCLESKDIQAFPGSGKTTALVAKLAILSRKWTDTYHGICVLSHTNVAREEVEQRLSMTETGRKLLNYPHFIGTFQTFFDTYISKPWLHSLGYAVNIVDNEKVVKNRYNKLSHNAKKYLKNKSNPEQYCAYSTNIGTINLGIKRTTDTMKSILNVIDESQKQGNYTYNEMLLFAEHALDNCTYISTALQNRFPIVLIDEAQDNTVYQWKLLDKVFSEKNIIIQSFGDKNQAIFSDKSSVEDSSKFPRKEVLYMNKSNRFDNRIASFANTVALDTEEMTGSDNEFTAKNVKHTIFLYDKEKVKMVLSAYGRLLVETFTDKELKRYKDLGCYAIGQTFYGQTDISNKNYPKSVADYVNEVGFDKFTYRQSQKKFIHYFFKGLFAFKATGEIRTFTEDVFLGIKVLLSLVDKQNFVPLYGNSFSQSIRNLSAKTQEEILCFLKKILDVNKLDKKIWSEKTCLIAKVVQCFGLNTKNLSQDEKDRLNEFLSWDDILADVNCFDETLDVKNFVYPYCDEASKRKVEINLGSIHSVKGQTQLATLVLETYYRAHNMKSILPYLIKSNEQQETSSINKKRLKCQYVAMTRAKALICLAMPTDNVDEKQVKLLEKLGWNIEKII